MNLLADILSLKYLSNNKELILIPEMYINIFFWFFVFLNFFHNNKVNFIMRKMRKNIYN
jgi:hypothetical protein